ncbi:adenylyltransferase/cytidyltransferase family protein [Pseudoalteromonas sp. ASV78]|uniref:adenylyltransferase/cytidyltransferase family protein n=1 Tax=Pseudoalteromonas sp. ASV78 TaxID=3397851 RepID=UPI0039FC9E08
MIVGYTSGVFDLLHNGHENFLRECKKQCDILYVGVDSDLRVKQQKGAFRPIQTAHIRLRNISKHCDHAFIKWKSSQAYLEKIQPNIIFESNLKEDSKAFYPPQSRCVKISYTEDVSTTKLIRTQLSLNTNAEIK